MVKAAVRRKDGIESTGLRCRAENSDDSSVWVAKGISVSRDEIVDVLRTNATNEEGFVFIRTSNNVEGFVKSEHISFMKCPVQREDEAESTMLRCRPENSQKNSVWVAGKVCVAQNEELEILRVNSAGEEGWAFVRTQDNVEGYLRAAYVGAPTHNEATINSNADGHAAKNDDLNQASRRTSSRVAASSAVPSATLHNFFAKTPSKPDSSSPSQVSLETKQTEEDAVRRSSRVRAPTKFLAKEMEAPSLDKWFQKCEAKPIQDSEGGEDAVGDVITPDVVVDDNRPLGDYLMKLRTYSAHETAVEDMWQLPATIQFFYLFRPHIPFPTIAMCALLSALSSPAPSADETLEKIHEGLLKGICGGIGAKLKDHWTRRLFLKVRQFYETHSFDGTNYDDLPPCTRLDLLYDLCCWRLDEGPDLGTDSIKDEEADVMRYESLGHSADHRTFYFFLDPDVDPMQSLWIFSDSSAITLAAHVKKYDRPIAAPSPKPEPKAAKTAKGKKSPAKKSPAKNVIVKAAVIVPCHIQPEYSGCWKLEAKGLDECKALASKFMESKDECETRLAEVIDTQVIKAAERRLAEQELAKKREARLKRELELSAAAGASRSKRERKKINYSDDNFNILDVAVEVERKSRNRGSVEVGAAGAWSGERPQDRPTRSAAKHATEMFKSISAWDKHGGAIIDGAVNGSRRSKRGRDVSGSSSSSGGGGGESSEYSGSSSSSSSSSSDDDSDNGSDSDDLRRRKRRDAAKSAAATKKFQAKQAKHSKKAHSQRRDSGLPPAPRVKNMYQPTFPHDADIAAVIAAVEDMPLLSGREQNAGLPCFKVARHLNKRGTTGPAADHLPEAELVRDTLLWLHELQEKCGVPVPSTALKLDMSRFDFGEWCLMDSDKFHMTPVIRKYVIDFWVEKQREEEVLQQRALALYLEAASSPGHSQQRQPKHTKQEQNQADSQEEAQVQQQPNQSRLADDALSSGSDDELQEIIHRKEDSLSSRAVPAIASAADGAVVATRDSSNDVYVHGKSADGRDSIVMCDVGDERDELFEEGTGSSVLDITADDGDV